MGASRRAPVDARASETDRPSIEGVPVREDDIEPVQGIRTIAIIFRGMAVIILLLMLLQVFFAMTSAVPLSPGVVIADAVRLIIYAGLLWGAGDLAVLFVKSHYDLRATRILMARVAFALKADGRGGTDGRTSTSDAPRPGGDV